MWKYRAELIACNWVKSEEDAGKMIFVAGQLARDARGNCVGKGDMRPDPAGRRKHQDLSDAVGATLADIVKSVTAIRRTPPTPMLSSRPSPPSAEA